MKVRPLLAGAVLVALAGLTETAEAQRSRGIDVSAWQGNVNWSQVRGSGIDFAFIRATRGGTTGTYNQSTQQGTLSHRYDDPFTAQNVAGARANNILPGVYHFARPDLPDNTGLDEANHFLEMAQQYMRPGHLRPVLDIEAGSQRTRTDLTNWNLEFSNRILEVTGVRPIVYINSSYANNEVDARLNTHDLWMARYIDPTVVDVQTVVDLPAASGLPNVYGVWNPTYPTMPNPRPWDFWQYTATGRTPGVTGNNDLNVANGDIEFVKDFLVPAMWFVNASGNWSTASNWNGVTVTPQPIDRVIINRTAGSYEVTLSTGSHAIRSLQLNERLTMTGGSLAIEQFANLASPTTISGNASFTADRIVNTNALSIVGGSVQAASLTGSGTTSVGGGVLEVGSLRQASLDISGGTVRLTSSAVSRVNQLSITDGRLDLGQGKLVIDFVSTSPEVDVRDTLFSARAGGTWTGPGIVADNLIGQDATLAVGYAPAGVVLTSVPGTWFGESVDATTLLLRVVRIGDSDLDGSVNFDDLVSLAQRYGTAGSHWYQGDFDYDGTVGFADLVLLAQNYGANFALATGALESSFGTDFAADWQRAVTLVPEPMSVGALLGAMVCMSRRSRRGGA